MIGFLVFLVSLPLTVYTLSGCLEVIDQADPAGRFRALLGLAFRVVLFALLTLSTPPEARLWILAGVITATVLSLAGQAALRQIIRSGRWPADRIE